MLKQPTLFRGSFPIVAMLALALAGCADDDPVAEAASHLCACERVNEPGTEVAACESEVEGILSMDSDCVTCVNANAGASANAQTCAALSNTCAAQCGFGEQ